jgi:hypothetical protein
VINYKELVKALDNMSYDGGCEDGYTFVNGYEEDFSYSFTISELTKDKYLVKIELYTNTRFPVSLLNVLKTFQRLQNWMKHFTTNVRNFQEIWIGS